jgi:hypothetical protein
MNPPKAASLSVCPVPRPRGFGFVLREMATADAVPFVYFQF